MTYIHAVDGSAIIVHKNANKEEVLKQIVNNLNISLSDVISFGDDYNDIGMIKASGIGVAMGNAIEELKKVADVITESNDNHGVACYINKYIL